MIRLVEEMSSLCERVREIGRYMLDRIQEETLMDVVRAGTDDTVLESMSLLVRLVPEASPIVGMKHVRENREFEDFFYLQILPLFLRDEEILELDTAIRREIVTGEERRVILEKMREIGRRTTEGDVRLDFLVARECVRRPWRIASALIRSRLMR